MTIPPAAQNEGAQLALFLCGLMGEPTHFDLRETGPRCTTLLSITGLEKLKKVFIWAWPQPKYDCFTGKRWPIASLVKGQPEYKSVTQVVGDHEHAARTGRIPLFPGEESERQAEKRRQNRKEVDAITTIDPVFRTIMDAAQAEGDD